MDELNEADENAYTQNESSNRCNLVPSFKTMSFIVAVGAAGLPDHAQVVHGKKGQVETNEHEGEDKLAKFVVQHFAGQLRQPEVKARV